MTQRRGAAQPRDEAKIARKARSAKDRDAGLRQHDVFPPPAALEQRSWNAETLVGFQRSVGNQAVRRLLSSDLNPIQRNAKFDKITGPAVEKIGAPKELAIPKAAKDGMQAAWAASFPGGKSKEQGGILVKTKAGKYEWRAGPAGEGGSFSPNYGDVKDGETLIATGHTHPYDESEGGATDISLSGGDISSMIYDPAPTGIVQSGDAIFIVAKTKEFEKLVADANTTAKKQTLETEIDDLWDTEFAAAQDEGLDFVEAVEKTARTVCDKYHLLYYAGNADAVSQPDDEEVHVEEDPAPATTGSGTE